MSAVSMNQTGLKYWGPIAYTRFFLYSTAYILKLTGRHIMRKTPKGQSLPEGCLIQIIRLIMTVKVLNASQARKMMSLTNEVVHLSSGTFRQSSRDKWATKVKGKGWEGFWIPFKDQLNKENLKRDLAKKVSEADIGAECDIVMFAIHGGGMVLGDALMFLRSYRSWMKLLQKDHGVKIGILSVEYSLSPEVPYPGALNECVAAYRHLIEHQRVDPRRVVMCGDSAGANLCLTTALKLRDEYPHIGLPAGQVLFSPWVMCPEPMKDTPDDYIGSGGGQYFMSAYTQDRPEVKNSPYASPISAPTLAGMPPMLIFIGGVESLRPSIDRFVLKAVADGVDVQAITKEGKVHDYALIDEIAGRKTVKEAEVDVGKFVAQVRDRYIGLEWVAEI